MLTFRCSACPFEKQVSRKLLGKKAKCPRCKTISLIEEQLALSSDSVTTEEDSDDWWSDLDLDAEEDDFSDEDFDEELPVLPASKRSRQAPHAGLPPRRSFFTTALLASLPFGLGMGIYVTVMKGVVFGVLTCFVGGPLFGLAVAFFLSGKQVVVQFEQRSRFLKDLKGSFQYAKHYLADAADPIFVFQYEKAMVFNICHVHVGKKEAVVVGPRVHVKQGLKKIAKKYNVNWSGKKQKENHGIEQPDRLANWAWGTVAVGMILCLLVFRASNSPEGKARSYVLSRLKSPSESKFVSTQIVKRDSEGTVVKVVFDAPNSFGIKLRGSMNVLISNDGSIQEW